MYTQALAVVCMILHYMSLGERNTITIMLTSGTFVGFTIILIALFVSEYNLKA